MQDIEPGDLAGREASAMLRERLWQEGKLTGWDNVKYPVKAGYSPWLVQKYCVNDSEWQGVRLSMKGKDTSDKLAVCKAWWERKFGIKDGSGLDIVEVQVGNYLGALRRGGQLNDDNQIRKER